MNFTAEQIAAFLQGTIEGDPRTTVNNVSKIEEGKPGTLAFLANPKYEKYIYESQASIILINKNFKAEKDIRATLIRVENAYESFARLLDLYEQSKPKKTGISKLAGIQESASLGENLYIGDFAVIGENAKIGNNAKIYPQVYVGDNAEVGENTILYPGVKIYHECKIGANCIIHAGTVIGSDGFGFAMQQDGEERIKVPQVGNVVIEDEVEIGSNVSIDRATMGSTIIRKGVKMDNLIQIAHNVEIGENSVIVAQAGIAGSTKLGKNVIIAAQAGLVGHISIADRVIVAAQAGVPNSIKKEGEVVIGSPAFNIGEFKRSAAIFKQLPDLRNTVLQLERDMKEIKNQDQ